MGKHPFGGLVRCPYYKYEEPQMIYCEGVVNDSSLHLAFHQRHKCVNTGSRCARAATTSA